MIERIIEYKEAREFRKDRKRRQDQKRALMVLVPCMVILLIGAGISALVGKEEKPVPAAQTVATPSQASEPVEVVPSVDEEEIEQFAYIMTKPIEDVTGDELEFMGEKAEDPCFERYSLLPVERMIAKITACKEAG
jgi:hypothetical protein